MKIPNFILVDAIVWHSSLPLINYEASQVTISRAIGLHGTGPAGDLADARTIVSCS